MRKAVRIFLNGRTDFTIVGEATNCAETIKGLKDLRPDVLLLDLRMPESRDGPMTSISTCFVSPVLVSKKNV
jgi:DNA-binding NarL/FixJ family response regulator